ncbi:MAG: glycosyltransferase, partial [bacterium]
MSGLILTAAGIYLLFGILVWIGLQKKFPLTTRGVEQGSLLICARNEEKSLPACLDSLEKQEIATDRLEVILIDDDSHDRTAQIMEEYAKHSRFSVRVLHFNSGEAGDSSGKWRLLNEGIRQACHEALLFTDANAVLKPGWVEAHLSRLDRGIQVAGMIWVDGPGVWSSLQRLDRLFVMGVGCSLARWGQPQAAQGKNLSLHRWDYDAVGGFEAIGPTLTEDQALVRALHGGGGRLDFSTAPELLVNTPALRTWKEFLQQRLRWSSGFQDLSLIGKSCIIVMLLRQLALLLGLATLNVWALPAWIAVSVVDF